METEDLRKKFYSLSFWMVVVESAGIWAIAIALWVR